MTKKLTAIPLIAFAAMALPTASTHARGENEITRLAHTIQQVGREIRNEFQTHYTRSSAYRHLRTDIDTVLSKADHIDRISHDPRTSYQHILADLEELDKLSHHLHEVVDDVERGRYSGWVEGGLQHVHLKMSSLNAAIHSMQRALVAYSTPGHDDCPYSRGASSHSSSYDYNRGTPGQYDTRYGSQSDFYYHR